MRKSSDRAKARSAQEKVWLRLGSRWGRSRPQPPVGWLLWIGCLWVREDRRIDARRRDHHAHQFAALDSALVRAFGHRVTAGMVLARLLAVTILHRWLGHGAACQSGANWCEAHCECNQECEKHAMHSSSCSLRPQAVNSSPCKSIFWATSCSLILMNYHVAEPARDQPFVERECRDSRQNK
jgi:hypothetical protein